VGALLCQQGRAELRDCPLLPVCRVAELIAPMRAEGETGGAQRPRPYVLRPPAERVRRYDSGAALSFGLCAPMRMIVDLRWRKRL
jgi:hypothetical protein